METLHKPILIKDLGYLYPKETSKAKRKYGIYKCYCGEEFKAQSADINYGSTKSCGCLKTKTTIKRLTRHGFNKHRLYNIWAGIIQRCTNKNEIGYDNYGGRGIKVCNEWKNDFILFKDWSYKNGYNEKLTIDRINVNGDYEPSNCRWSTYTIQNRNTRKRKDNTSGYRGVSLNKKLNKYMSYITVDKKRIHLGLFLTSIEAAITYDKYVIENNLEHTKNFS